MRFKKIFLLYGIFFASAIVTAQVESNCTPTQIHLSLGDEYYSVSRFDHLRLPSERFNDNQAYLVFEAPEDCEFSVQTFELETNKSVLTQVILLAQAQDYRTLIVQQDGFLEEEEETQGNLTTISDQLIYTAHLRGLEFGSSYNYTIINRDGDILAGPFKFKLARPFITNSTERKKMLILGGLENKQVNDSYFSHIESLNNEIGAIVQLGDVDCDGDIDCQNLFNQLQPMSSQIPILFTATGSNSSLRQKVENPLFSMTHNNYYSFNLEGIHFVFVSFEHYENSQPEAQHSMFLWIDNDLRRANDEKHRENWPWIVVLTDKPINCSAANCGDNALRKYWEELFNTYKVNLVISGNKGYYERFSPVYGNTNGSDLIEDQTQNIINATAPMYILEDYGAENVTNQTQGLGKLIIEQPGYGLLSTQNNSNNSTLTYERCNHQGQKLDTINLIQLRPQSQLLGEEDLVFPGFEKEYNNNKVESRENQPFEETEASDHKYSIALLVIVLLVFLIVTGSGGYLLWKKKKIEDPEHERLQMSAFKSIKIYNPKKEKNISMVDLVL